METFYVLCLMVKEFLINHQSLNKSITNTRTYNRYIIIYFFTNTQKQVRTHFVVLYRRR